MQAAYTRTIIITISSETYVPVELDQQALFVCNKLVELTTQSHLAAAWAKIIRQNRQLYISVLPVVPVVS